MENGIESINENIIEEEERQEVRKISKRKIIGLIAAGLIISTTLVVFLVGYFHFGWFQKSQDNVIQNNYHENQVLLFNELKTISTEITTKVGKEVFEQNILNDFLVIINSKSKLNYFGVIDNLYNATLVIIKTSTNDKVVGGLNILDNENSERFLKNPEKYELPIAKFAFYENGTLLDINIANDATQFYATSIVELIEQIIPRISKKYYNKEQKGVEFSYDEEKNDPKKKLL